MSYSSPQLFVNDLVKTCVTSPDFQADAEQMGGAYTFIKTVL